MEVEAEAETMTPCTFMWPSWYHKCPCLNRQHGKSNFHAEGKRETSNFRCVLVALLGAVRNFRQKSNFRTADLPVYSEPSNTAKWNPEKWTKETQQLMTPLE